MLQILIFPILILAVSIIGLAVSSSFAIRAVEKLIRLTGLSDVSAGFVILAVLTSAPEMTVAFFSITGGAAGIIVGDILGSNIFNIGVVLGLFGILGYLKMCCTDLLLDLTDMLFITSAIPLILVIFGAINYVIGLLLFSSFFMVNLYLLKTRKKTPKVELAVTPVKPLLNQSRKTELNENHEVKRSRIIEIVFTVLILMGSLFVVIISANFVVDSALDIVTALGIPPILVGAKIVSVGTSLPELAVDAQAIRHGRVHLAIGDILGSNLTNLTLVLGLSILVNPLGFNLDIFTRILPYLLITTIVFWRYLARGSITKFGGVLLLSTYVLFQVLVF